MNKLVKLFQPIKLGRLELPNRIIMAALTTNYDADGGVDRLSNFYAARARGGAGLITVGGLQSLYPGRRLGRHRLNLHSDSDIPKLLKYTKAIRDNGGKASAQIATYAYWAKKGDNSTAEDVGPSEVTLPRNGTNPTFGQAEFIPKTRPLTGEEILMIEEAIGDAAVRAQKAGFDALELHVGGGSLMVHFINPFTNRRTDEYGGSLENRMKMLVETIANIKKKVGDDFPLICKILGMDMVPWGLTLEGWKQIARIIEKVGVHALIIAPGWYDTREPRHQMSVPRGAFVYLAKGVKEVVNIPVAASIRINDPLLAEQILEEGKADLIAMARPLIADPDLPNKAKEGRLDDIRMCTACCRCYEDVFSGQAVTCSVNAEAGKEIECSITPVSKSKKVFVVGGGPAGMESARVAALRGHKVTLFERDDKLGGQLLYAVLPPYKQEWNTLLKYLTTQLLKLHVEVKLNEECNIRTIEKSRPDVVIAATGATPIIPCITGVDGKNVTTAMDVLIGRKEFGRNVVIIGGGLIGCETAEFLSQQGKQVTILEMLPRVAMDVGEWNRWVLIDRLSNAGIRVETNARVEEITEKGVRIVRPGNLYEFFEADSVVIALGMEEANETSKELGLTVGWFCKVGDCVQPRKVREAIESGFRAGQEC